MKRHKLFFSVRLILVAALALTFGISQSYAQSANKKDKTLRPPVTRPTSRNTRKSRRPCRRRRRSRPDGAGLLPGVAGLAGTAAAAVPGRPQRRPPRLRRPGRDPALLRPLRQLGVQPAA